MVLRRLSSGQCALLFVVSAATLSLVSLAPGTATVSAPRGTAKPSAPGSAPGTAAPSAPGTAKPIAVGPASGRNLEDAEFLKSVPTCTREAWEQNTLALPDYLKRVDQWPHGILFAQWNNYAEPIRTFDGGWAKLLEPYVKPGSVVIDIGGHVGDTPLPLAHASRGGTVIAFEMGPPFKTLKCNVGLNPQLDIRIHKLAVSDSERMVDYTSGCGGCNGGISTRRQQYRVQSIRLVPFLTETYGADLLKNISFIKIDTEGHDKVILRDIKEFLHEQAPVVWVEWFAVYHEPGAPEKCSKGSQDLFDAIREVGYQPCSAESFKLGKPAVVGCTNKEFTRDLLLLPPGWDF